MPDRELGPPGAESTPPSDEPPFCGSAFLHGPLHGPGAAAFEAHHAGGNDKPPRGAMPDWVWRTKRATELADAIRAYLGRSSRLALDCIESWSAELAEHSAWLRNRAIEMSVAEPGGDYESGRRRAYLSTLSHVLSGLGVDDANAGNARWVIERQETTAALRKVCAEHGDNDWSDGQHLGEVIREHLAEPLRSDAPGYLRREEPSPDSGVTFAPIRVDLPPSSKAEQATFEAIRSMSSDPIGRPFLGEANRHAVASRIVDRMIGDMCGVHSLGMAWGGCDPAIKAVQRAAWERIIREALAGG